MGAEEKIHAEAALIAAVTVDQWLVRNRAQITNGAGLLRDVRIDLMDSMTRAIKPLIRAGLEASARPSEPEENDVQNLEGFQPPVKASGCLPPA